MDIRAISNLLNLMLFLLILVLMAFFEGFPDTLECMFIYHTFECCFFLNLLKISR